MTSDKYTEALAKLEARKARKAKREGKMAEIGSKGAKRIKKVPKAKLHKRLVKALDKEFSLWVRAKWPICFFPACGQPTKDCFHFFTRAKRSIRWDPRNAVGSCKGHNILYEQDQSFIDDVRIWFVSQYGQEVWDDLKRLGHELVDWDNDFLAAKLDEIKGLKGPYAR